MYFSKNKEREMIRLYPNTTDMQISRIIGIPTWLVTKRAEELGLERGDRWDLSYVDRVSIQMLEVNYPTISNVELADALGMTKMQIEHEAFRLGLKKNEEFWSNIIITREEKELVEKWDLEYNHNINGNSRGNFVLDKILQYIFPLHTIKPEEPIGGLKIDLYIKELMIGFEFQGIQHEQFNNFHYKTKADFIRAQNRDIDKSFMCEKSNIALVYFYHDEKLSIPLVKAKIGEVL